MNMVIVIITALAAIESATGIQTGVAFFEGLTDFAKNPYAARISRPRRSRTGRGMIWQASTISCLILGSQGVKFVTPIKSKAPDLSNIVQIGSPREIFLGTENSDTYDVIAPSVGR